MNGPVAEGREAPGGARGRGALRRSYDAVASEYDARLHDELDHKPWDRALLAALLEQAGPRAAVADLGCGPGHVTAWLAAHGARAVGIDLSPAMVGLAKSRHPGAEFRVGDLLALPAADGEFAAAVALYSIIHLPEAEIDPALGEMCRVLRPGGALLVAFHVGAETRRLTEWWGVAVDLEFRFLEAGRVSAGLEAAGMRVEMALERLSHPEEVESRRAYLLARRPVA